MEMKKPKIVWVNILSRYRILTNQRTHLLAANKQFSDEYLKDLFQAASEQSKVLQKSLKITALYLILMYLSRSGSDFELSFLNAKLSDIPSLLEISVFLFSSSLFVLGCLCLNSHIMRETIDSVISSVVPNDSLSINLIKYLMCP